MAATGSGLQLPVRGHRRGDKVKATRSGHGHGSGHADPLQPGAKCAQEANGGSDPCAHDRTRADKSAGRPRADPGRRALVTYGFPGGAARTCAMTRRGARSVRHANHAVAEALRLHLAHMTSPFTFDGLLADHRPGISVQATGSRALHASSARPEPEPPTRSEKAPVRSSSSSSQSPSWFRDTRDQPPGVARVLRILRDARMLAVRHMPALPCMRSARCVQRSRLQRDEAGDAQI